MIEIRSLVTTRECTESDCTQPFKSKKEDRDRNENGFILVSSFHKFFLHLKTSSLFYLAVLGTIIHLPELTTRKYVVIQVPLKNTSKGQ